MQAPELLKQLLFGDRGGLSRLRFYEDGWVSALVPDGERFGLARELVLQRIYDAAGGIGGATIVDAGANVGLFSLVASKKAQKVIALEPDPINYRVLEINIQTNDVTNVTALNAALGEQDGEVRFATGTRMTDGRISDEGDTSVEALSLDSIVERYGDIDLLKLDIEGAEERVLPSTKALPHVRRIVAELHLNEPGEEQPMLDALASAGFDARVIPASSLYEPRWVPIVLRNWRRLDGQLLVKVGLVVYLMAPFTKPRRPGRDMPLLVANRTQ